VLVVDDHPALRLSVVQLLDEAGFDVIADVATAAEALSTLAGQQPDVAVVDLRLANTDGAALCRSIKERWPSVACLVYSAGEDFDLIADAINAGAAGMVFKGRPVAELVDAVRVVAAGGESFPNELPDRVVEAIHSRTRKARAEPLTSQEEKILILLGEGHSNLEIAERLALAEKTVRNHVSHLLGKLGLRDRTQAALYAARRRA
jgi:two-component system response regulator DevR